MIKITNGIDVFEVSNGAYEGIYSRQGFHPLQENAVMFSGELTEDTSEEQAFAEEIVEKPISMWTKEELKRFADFYEIDLSGMTSTENVRQLVKEFIDGQ